MSKLGGNVRSLLDVSDIAGGGGGAGGIPNPIPEAYIVQWGELAGPSGSFRWVLTDKDTLSLTGQAFSGPGGASERSTDWLAVTGAASITDPVAGRSGQFSFITGPIDTTHVANVGSASGAVNIGTGDAANTGASPTPPDSGDILIVTGANVANGESGFVAISSGGGAGETGVVSMRSGQATGAQDSGAASFGSGPNIGTGLSGNVDLLSGDTSDGDSGAVQVFSGDAALANNTGTVSVLSGSATGAGGDSGSVLVQTGTVAAGAGTRGEVILGSDDAALDLTPGNVRLPSPVALDLRGADCGTGPTPGTVRNVLVERWLSLPAAPPNVYPHNPGWNLLVAGGGTAAYAVGGGVEVVTGIGGGDSTVVRPTNANPTPWGVTTWDTSEEVQMRGALILGPIADTSTELEVGIRPTVNAFDIATDDNKMMLRADDGVDGNWHFVTSNAGTDNDDDTGVAVANDGPFNFAFVVRADRSVRCYINGVRVDDGTHTLAAAVSLGDPYFGVLSNVAAARRFFLFPAAVSNLPT